MKFTQEIALISINDILINHENPRHNPVMALDETIVMQQLISSKKDANAMHKLIDDIFTNGWFPQSIITVTYDEQKKKYIAWDGNRRITALKILQNPKLLENLKYFNYAQITSIHSFSEQIKSESFFTVSCFIAANFEECAGYIKSIHTTDTGALRWNSVAIRRFENKLGLRNTFSQLQGLCPKAFDKIDEKFPVSKFEKITNSKIGREFLEIKKSGNRIIPQSNLDILNEKVAKIIDDINNNVITQETISSTKKITEYLYPMKTSITQTENSHSSSPQPSATFSASEPEQITLLSAPTEDLLPLHFNEKTKLLTKDTTLIFRNLNTSHLNKKNERAPGISHLTYEIQHFSQKLYLYYPMAFCFLIRSLLEQSSIYFLINKKKWYGLVKNNNNKDLKLEKILEYVSRNKHNLLDDTTRRAWNICFESNTNKDYLDLVIHQPHKIVANTSIIQQISDAGLFAIIQYFINN